MPVEEPAEEQHLPLTQRIADTIADFSGSITFLLMNFFLFLFWILDNTLGPFRFDAYPFQFLTMSVSLEAIFLSIFVLVSQKRQEAHDRAMTKQDLDADLASERIIRDIAREMTERFTFLEEKHEHLDERLEGIVRDLAENTELTRIRRKGRRMAERLEADITRAEKLHDTHD